MHDERPPSKLTKRFNHLELRGAPLGVPRRIGIDSSRAAATRAGMTEAVPAATDVKLFEGPYTSLV
jgi:hypothetical protein